MTERRFWDYRCCCFGSDAGGTQRYRYLRCLKTFPSRATASRRCTCCSRQPAGGPACWWWGNSLRATARLVGIEPATGLSLLSTAGGAAPCGSALGSGAWTSAIWNWTRSGRSCAPSRSEAPRRTPTGSGAHCYIAIEHYTHLILAWHLGK